MKLEDSLSTPGIALDITPLIDIIFLLVIFFAVTTSFINPQDLELLQRQLAGLISNQSELQQQLIDSRDQNNELIAQTERLQTSFQQLKTQQQQTDADFEAALVKIQQLSAELASTREQQKLAQRLHEQELRQQQQTVQQLSEELQLSELIKAEYEAAEKTLRDELSELHQTLIGQENELQTLRLSLATSQDTLTTERGRHTEQQENLRRQLQQRQAELNRRQDAEQQLRRDLDQLQRDNKALDASLAVSENINKALQITLNSEQQRLQQLQTERQQLEQKFNAERTAFTRQLTAMEDRHRKLKKNLDELLALVDTLRQENQRYQSIAHIDKEKSIRMSSAEEELSAGLSTMTDSDAVTIKREPHQLVLNLSNRVLFDSGSDELKPQGLTLLAEVGKLLNTEMVDLDIHVTGYTDNVPIRGRFNSNWALSAARAVNVVDYLERVVGIDGSRLAAVGRGQHQALAENNTETGRAQNRRIELVLVPRSPQP